MIEPWVSAEAIAQRLGVTENRIYTWLASNGMPAHTVGGLWKFKNTEPPVRGRGADDRSSKSAAR